MTDTQTQADTGHPCDRIVIIREGDEVAIRCGCGRATRGHEEVWSAFHAWTVHRGIPRKPRPDTNMREDHR